MKKLLSIFVLAAVAFAAQAVDVTVFDGTDQNDCVPIRATYYDYWDVYNVQFIYPAAELTALQGKEITSVKFYVANENGNVMNGGQMALYIGTTTQSSFSDFSTSFISDDAFTKVAEISMVHGVPEIVFDFDEPWTYEGGNIVIYTVIDADGSVVGSEATNFLGEAVEAASACGNWSVTAKDFIPKTTFTYGEGGDEPQVLRGDANDDGEVNISDVTAIVDNLLNSTPINMTNADCNNEEGVNIGDVTALIDFLMVGVWN
jgi:hypothetical protein